MPIATAYLFRGKAIKINKENNSEATEEPWGYTQRTAVIGIEKLRLDYTREQSAAGDRKKIES
jgi:hypothetical protein